MDEPPDQHYNGDCWEPCRVDEAVLLMAMAIAGRLSTEMRRKMQMDEGRFLILNLTLRWS